MSKFWFYIITNILIMIASLIDTGFGNSISIDSVCVLSSYTVLTWITYCTYAIGCYAYRILLDKFEICVLLNILFGILCCFICILGRNYIPHIYHLTQSQYQLFSKCLFIHGLLCPIYAIMEILYTYVEYNYNKKCIIVGNIVYYSLMLLCDAYVVYTGKSLVWLISGTLVSTFIYDILLLFMSGVLKNIQIHYKWKDFKLCLYHGLNTYIDRILGKVATTVFNIFASRLGTELYVIHSVCYMISTSLEYITNGYYTFVVVTLQEYSNKLKKVNELKRKYRFLCILLAYLFGYLLLLFVHGKVSIKYCIIWLALYILNSVALVKYETYRGYLSSVKESKSLRFGGLIGIIARLPITIIGYYLGFGLIPFAIACFIDFLSRGIYYQKCSEKIRI